MCSYLWNYGKVSCFDQNSNILFINLGAMKISVNICELKRNLTMILLRKTKRNFFRNLNEKKLSGNRKLWMEIKPYFLR